MRPAPRLRFPLQCGTGDSLALSPFEKEGARWKRQFRQAAHKRLARLALELNAVEKEAAVGVLRVAVDQLREQLNELVVLFMAPPDEAAANLVRGEPGPAQLPGKAGAKDAGDLEIRKVLFERKSARPRDGRCNRLHAVRCDKPIRSMHVAWPELTKEGREVGRENLLDIVPLEVDERDA